MKLSRTTTILIALLVLISSTTIVFSAAAEDEIDPIHPDFPELKITEEDIDNVLGGGQFIGLHNDDNDAMIGLLYGTEENPNNVYIVSIYTRYLGTADVYDEDGALIARDHPIPVRTMYAQRFDTIYEFNDKDQDGMWDSRLTEETNSTDEVSLMETVYKKVPLKTAWTQSEVQTTEHDNGTLEWTVSLTATDLDYKGPLFGFRVNRLQALEKVELTFHLYITPKDVTREGVPVYRVEVEGEEGSYEVTDTELETTRTYSGQSIGAEVKFDHYFEGWDYSIFNTNKALMMSTEVIFANAMSLEATSWAQRQFGQEIQNANGEAEFETDAGQRRVGESNAAEDHDSDNIYSESERPEIIRKNRLSINDNWQNVGSLTWVSDVEVDGRTDEMFFQVYYAKGFAGQNKDGAGFAGFALIGGFTYPGGETIYHDPSYMTEAVSLNTDGNGSPFGPFLLRIICLGLIATALVAVLAAVVIFLLAKTKSRDALDRGGVEANGDYYDTYYMDDEPIKKK